MRIKDKSRNLVRFASLNALACGMIVAAPAHAQEAAAENEGDIIVTAQ